MGSPDAHQPPMQLPARPMSSAVTEPMAELRATTAALGSALTFVEDAQTGVPARPPYHEPKRLAAPRAASTRNNGNATSQVRAPCNAASSARRKPAMDEVTQPPATNEKNAPATLKTNPQNVRSCRLTTFFPT